MATTVSVRLAARGEAARERDADEEADCHEAHPRHDRVDAHRLLVRQGDHDGDAPCEARAHTDNERRPMLTAVSDRDVV
jgi:hypothetical protein